jgi:hypothetical protein
MSSKNKVLFEVFVPQSFAIVTIRRTTRTWEMDFLSRRTGEARSIHKHPRKSPTYSNAQFTHDFEVAMGMPGSKPL